MEKKAWITKPMAAALLAALCNLLWGSAIPFINLGYRLFAIENGAIPTQILFAGCRFFLAGLLTIAFASMQAKRLVRPSNRGWRKMLCLGMVQTVGQYVFFYIGVANTLSVKASLIQGLGAFVSILIACIVFRSERMNALKWIGGLLGVAGVTIVNLNGAKLDATLSLQGEGALLVSLCASACSAGLIKLFAKDEDPVALSGWQFMFGGLMMIAGGLSFGGNLTVVTWPALAVLLYLAALSAVAYTVWALLLKHHPVSRIAVYMFLQPIFGVILGVLMLNQQQDLSLLRYATALMLVSASIVVVGKGQQKQ